MVPTKRTVRAQQRQAAHTKRIMKTRLPRRHLLICTLLSLGLLLAGCASQTQRNPEDPFEPFNRKMFALNEGLDRAVVKPAARGYETVTPYPVRLHIGNFFNNLEDGWTVVNNALQLRPEAFLQSFFRFSFNTFWGMGGMVNVADSMGFERQPQDLGKTLGRWGVAPGPYLVLPVWGPSTLRDTAAMPAELHYDLINQKVDHIPSRNSLYTLELVDKRAKLLATGDLLDEAALDKYAFTRNAFLQKRQSEIDDLHPNKTHDEQRDDWGTEQTSPANAATAPNTAASAAAAAILPKPEDANMNTPAATTPPAKRPAPRRRPRHGRRAVRPAGAGGRHDPDCACRIQRHDRRRALGKPSQGACHRKRRFRSGPRPMRQPCQPQRPSAPHPRPSTAR